MTQPGASSGLKLLIRDVIEELMRDQKWPTLRGCQLRQAVVLAYSQATRTYSIYLGGDTDVQIDGVPSFAAYVFVIGETVWLLQNGSDLIILGSTSLDAVGMTKGVTKLVDEAVTNSTTLQNDNELFLPVTANSQYALHMFLMIQGPPAGDFRFDFALPTACFLNINCTEFQRSNAEGQRQIITGGSGGRMMKEGEDIRPATFGVVFGTDSSWIEIVGQVNVAATAGTVQFRWAQNTLDAGNTSVIRGSWMVLTRVG